MSFDAFETSTEDGAPIELYKIEGDNTFFYTSSSVPYTFEGDEYEPIAISRSGPRVTEQSTSGNLTIKFPFDNAFALRYLAGVPPSPDRLTIFQVHLSQGGARDVQPFWSGYVSGVKFKDEEATVTVAGIMSRTAVQIPSNTFSWACNHVLYGARCKVQEGLFQYGFIVDSISSDGTELTLSDADATNTAVATITADPDYFAGGTLRTGTQGEQRMLLSMSYAASVYTARLMVPIGITVGQAVTISAGCDRSIQLCASRFNNSENYGGFPFIPSLNPFSTDVKREE